MATTRDRGLAQPDPRWSRHRPQLRNHLARCGLAITSGLAIGIDAAAHQGALDADGVTIAVCGTGLDVAYPKSNARSQPESPSSGALVSEFPLGLQR